MVQLTSHTQVSYCATVSPQLHGYAQILLVPVPHGPLLLTPPPDPPHRYDTSACSPPAPQMPTWPQHHATLLTPLPVRLSYTLSYALRHRPCAHQRHPAGAHLHHVPRS